MLGLILEVVLSALARVAVGAVWACQNCPFNRANLLL
jgi:hypothetical protein